MILHIRLSKSPYCDIYIYIYFANKSIKHLGTTNKIGWFLFLFLKIEKKHLLHVILNEWSVHVIWVFLQPDVIRVWLKSRDAAHVQRPWEEDCLTASLDCLDMSRSPLRPWGEQGGT